MRPPLELLRELRDQGRQSGPSTTSLATAPAVDLHSTAIGEAHEADGRFGEVAETRKPHPADPLLRPVPQTARSPRARERDANDNYTAWTRGEWDEFERLAAGFEDAGKSNDEAVALARQRVAEGRAERARKGEAPSPPDPAYAVRPRDGAPTPSIDDDWRASKRLAREGFARTGIHPSAQDLDGATRLELDRLDHDRRLEAVYAGRLAAILGTDGRAVVLRRETEGSA
jgi:hypothetical protein